MQRHSTLLSMSACSTCGLILLPHCCKIKLIAVVVIFFCKDFFFPCFLVHIINIMSFAIILSCSILSLVTKKERTVVQVYCFPYCFGASDSYNLFLASHILDVECCSWLNAGNQEYL